VCSGWSWIGVSTISSCAPRPSRDSNSPSDRRPSGLRCAASGGDWDDAHRPAGDIGRSPFAPGQDLGTGVGLTPFAKRALRRRVLEADGLELEIVAPLERPEIDRDDPPVIGIGPKLRRYHPGLNAS
jgi:hypothetical protein